MPASCKWRIAILILSAVLARYMLSPVRLSVSPSVSPSHGWISRNRL